jgi:hypothetical protein
MIPATARVRADHCRQLPRIFGPTARCHDAAARLWARAVVAAMLLLATCPRAHGIRVQTETADDPVLPECERGCCSVLAFKSAEGRCRCSDALLLGSVGKGGKSFGIQANVKTKVCLTLTFPFAFS